MKTHQPQERHRAFRDDAIELLRKHGEHISAHEMLALSAHLVGQVIALQDQRTMTADLAMDVVLKNIELGNAEAMRGVTTEPPQGSA